MGVTSTQIHVTDFKMLALHGNLWMVWNRFIMMNIGKSHYRQTHLEMCESIGGV